MKATLKALLGVDLPVIQAPMAGVQLSTMTLAVSNAGGLGSLPCAMLEPAVLHRELSAIRAQTDRPFHLNFFCHTTPTPDAQAATAWASELKPYYREFGVDAGTIASGPGRLPFDAQVARLVAEFAPPVVSFHFGLPPAELVAAMRACGAKILGCATTLEEGRWLAAQGVDAVIAQGLEAGGHRGHFLSQDLSLQMGTLALVPQMVRALDIPVIAAGGIADPQGVAAALSWGAVAAQVGTAYLLCTEAITSAVHRAALRSDSSRHTALTSLFTGRPARGIMNRVMRELGPLNPHTPAFPLATGPMAPLRAKAEALGLGDFSPLWAGQNTSMCKEVSAAQLTLELAGLR